jgi:hypothetical protein
MRLVAHVAKKYQSQEDEMEDLISIGTIGLIKAVETYKEDYGSRLATYAARSPFFIFFRHSLSCSIVNGDKNVFKTHLKSFLDTSYVWGKFSVLFLFYFFAFLAIIVLWT